MIRPQKNKLIHWFFHRYINGLIKSNFESVKFNQVMLDKDKSVLLLANHFSWWDGFVLYYLNHQLLQKKFHIMILEDTVKKVLFLKYMGAFSVVKSSRQMIESLNFAAELLQDPNNLVLMFPQGRLYSNFVDEINFENGLSRIIKAAKGKFQFVFAQMFTENFQYKKPGINIYVERYLNDNADIEEVKTAFQAHYTSAKLQQIQIVV